MKKRWKNRTLIGCGHVVEDLIDSFRGSAGETRWERAQTVDFRHASQTQYRGCCTSAWLLRALLDKLFANLRILGLKPYHRVPPRHRHMSLRLRGLKGSEVDWDR
jgi:hypothetical protein